MTKKDAAKLLGCREREIASVGSHEGNDKISTTSGTVFVVVDDTLTVLERPQAHADVNPLEHAHQPSYAYFTGAASEPISAGDRRIQRDELHADGQTTGALLGETELQTPDPRDAATEVPDNFDTMTKAQLLEFAEGIGIELTGKVKKLKNDDLRDLITKTLEDGEE